MEIGRRRVTSRAEVDVLNMSFVPVTSKMYPRQYVNLAGNQDRVTFNSQYECIDLELNPTPTFP